ncbi:DegT/DnrJ/EryC1/StrS family aminotransferase [Sphingomonas arantia]|uniref:DegT/DnrJ/EryC1/StrS family aminotransferase n=1 Tax=Sphingomonas arantia TaxID=1460676 RepID=A0ABW4U3B1_9SPHN
MTAAGQIALPTPAAPSNVMLVTQPFMPPLDEYVPYLEEIWKRKWLTNSGAMHEELEARLAAYLDVPHLSLVSNGTVALWLALRALRVGGEVITTPFTFVATAHALRLVGAVPVFVDVDPITGNLDPAAVAAAVTLRTTAILPVHCFGQPCDTTGIAEVAARHGLKVIYDAAHAFGVRDGGESLLRQGDMATLSFHATKVFNTVEGGAVVSPDYRTKQRVDQLRNFGFVQETVLPEVALNAKMNEFQAAFGLLQLRYIDRSIAARGAIAARYRNKLADVAGIRPFPVPPEWTLNHSYFPVLVEPEYPESRDALWMRLQASGILARRYFHPLVSDMPWYQDLSSARKPMPNARRIAAQVICLPIHPEITPDDVDTIVRIMTGG